MERGREHEPSLRVHYTEQASPVQKGHKGKAPSRRQPLRITIWGQNGHCRHSCCRSRQKHPIKCSLISKSDLMRNGLPTQVMILDELDTRRAAVFPPHLAYFCPSFPALSYSRVLISTARAQWLDKILPGNSS